MDNFKKLVVHQHLVDIELIDKNAPYDVVEDYRNLYYQYISGGGRELIEELNLLRGVMTRKQTSDIEDWIKGNVLNKGNILNSTAGYC